MTDDVTLGGVADTQKIIELPLADRNPMQLALLGAGAAPTTTNAVPASLFTGGVTVTANGMRTTANQYSVDGANIEVGFYNFPGFTPPSDAVAEFKVKTGNYTAEYGGHGGAHIDYSLRSGTNAFHGTLLEFLRNDLLDARDAFALNKPVFRQNQFGGMGAGSHRQKQSRFHGDVSGPEKAQSIDFPNECAVAGCRTGDVSLTQGGSPQAPIRDPLSAQPFPSNVIPASRVRPGAAVHGLLSPAESGRRDQLQGRSFAPPHRRHSARKI